MQKTRKSIAKRFKKTGTGKLLRRTPGHRHLLRSKSVKQRRRAGSSKLVADGQRADLVRSPNRTLDNITHASRVT